MGKGLCPLLAVASTGRTILPSPTGLTAHSTAADGSTRRKAHDQLRLHLPARFNGKRHTCLPENKAPVPGACPPQLVTGHLFLSLATALPSSWQELPQLLIGSCFSGQSAGQVHPSPWERLSPQGSVQCLQLRLGAWSYPVSLLLLRLTQGGLGARGS